MKIIRLAAENVKRLRAVEITPTGDLVHITGGNEQGKTSVLDTISWGLAGGRNIQSKPIRKGAEKARIVLGLGDGKDVTLTVERTFTKSGTYLKVLSENGVPVQGPQQFLDKLAGALAFDPLVFSRSEPGKQAQILRDLSGVETADLDAAREKAYQKRRDLKRDLKQVEAEFRAAVEPPDGTGDEEESVDALVEKLREAQATNRKNNEVRTKAQQATATLEGERVAVDDLKSQLFKAEARLEQAGLAVSELVEQMKNLKDADEAGINASLATVEQRNRSVRHKKSRDTIIAKGKDLRAAVTAADSAVSCAEEEKAERIAGADLPIDGLLFDDAVVTYRGVPFDQCSSAEQLKVSMAVAMAMNPTLRIIRVTDGSLLDSASLKLIGEMAKGDDFQIWIECVDESGEVGIYIEDGQVKAIDGKPVA